MNKKIWWILVILILLILGIWSYTVGLRSLKVSQEKEIIQKKGAEGVITPEKERGITVRKFTHLPKRKVSLPSDYEPVSPEVKGIEDFEKEREREGQRKDIGIPTGWRRHNEKRKSV